MLYRSNVSECLSGKIGVAALDCVLCVVDFPSALVAQSYLQPAVDESEETFTWSTPNLDLLRQYPPDTSH